MSLYKYSRLSNQWLAWHSSCKWYSQIPMEPRCHPCTRRPTQSQRPILPTIQWLKTLFVFQAWPVIVRAFKGPSILFGRGAGPAEPRQAPIQRHLTWMAGLTGDGNLSAALIRDHLVSRVPSDSSCSCICLIFFVWFTLHCTVLHCTVRPGQGLHVIDASEKE